MTGPRSRMYLVTVGLGNLFLVGFRSKSCWVSWVVKMWCDFRDWEMTCCRSASSQISTSLSGWVEGSFWMARSLSYVERGKKSWKGLRKEYFHGSARSRNYIDTNMIYLHFIYE